MKMIRLRGSRLLMTSFGTPLVTITAAWDVKLLTIWLYGSPVPSSSNPRLTSMRDIQYMGYHINTEHALKPRRTSSTHLSSNVIHFGLWLSGILLGLAASQKSSPLRFL